MINRARARVCVCVSVCLSVCLSACLPYVYVSAYVNVGASLALISKRGIKDIDT
jgi:hypothetical protein